MSGIDSRHKTQILEAVDIFEATSKAELARYIGIPASTLKGRLIRVGISSDVSQRLESNKEAADKLRQETKRISHPTYDTLESNGPRIKTLDELLEASEVDLTQWRVKDYTVNAWEQHSVAGGIVTQRQVKARIERIPGVVELASLRTAAIEAMQEYSPSDIPKPEIRSKTINMMEINIYDLHLGAMSHAEETGDNYDSKIAIEAFRHVFYRFVEQGKALQVEKFVFPVGQDLLHVDTAENETTRGTRQDTDSRAHRSRRRAIDLMTEAINALLRVAPVEVVIVPGNHAREMESMVGEVLRAFYRNTDNITINDLPAPRKYVQYGANLIGFTHGDGVKASDLPLIMATEVPEMWATSRFRTVSTGHLHQRMSNSFGSVLEAKGVEVRVAPSLKATDSWHASMGYVNNLRAAQAFVYDKEEGEVARFTATLPPDFGKKG